MTSPLNSMLVKAVATVTAVDIAGRLVDAIPVYPSEDTAADTSGKVVTPTDMTEDERGVPVRIVAGLTALNSAGQVVAATLGKGAVINLAIFPYDFSNAAWGKNGTDTPVITSNTTVAPDGTLTADTITFGAAGVGNAGGYVFQARDVFEANVTYEISCYVKTAAGTKSFRFASWDGNADHQSADKVATTTWQLFTYSFTADALTTAGQDYGIRNAVGGGAGDIIVWNFFLRRL